MMGRTIRKRELTIAEAAAATGKSPDTIYRWVRGGKLRATETTDGLNVRTEDVLAAAARTRPGRTRVG